jgi:dihydrofolate reductase
MILSLIVAASENNVIGRNNALPWKLSDDLQRFRQMTLNHTIIMGRKTFESIGSKPLPNRENFVISKKLPSGWHNGYWVFPHLGDVLWKLFEKNRNNPDEEIFIIGGTEMFKTALSEFGQQPIGEFIIKQPVLSRIYLTRVHANIEGDAFFPEIDNSVWKLMHPAEHHEADDKNEYAFTFEDYERVR